MKVIAILESMWDWRQMTSSAGYREAPRYFRINPNNFSGRRLYRLVGKEVDLLVTNSCRELMGAASLHGVPDPIWLRENLEFLMPFDVLLVCGKVAQVTYTKSRFQFERKVELPHPAARMWTNAKLDEATKQIRSMYTYAQNRKPARRNPS